MTSLPIDRYQFINRLMTEADVCEQLAQGASLLVERPRDEPTILKSRLGRPNNSTTGPHGVDWLYRFIAVTQPIKYAKHRNSKRVFAMIVMTWIISITIGGRNLLSTIDPVRFLVTRDRPGGSSPN